MKIGKGLCAAIAAAAMLAALGGAASARNLSISDQSLRAAFREVRFAGAFGNITCPVTVEGSFHQRTTNKTAGSLVGYITRAVLGLCTEGQATVLRETLPWHIRYASFTGTLPNITSMRANIIGGSFSIREPFAVCLAVSTVERPGTIVFNRDTVTRVVTNAEVGGIVPSTCGVNGTFSSDRAPVTVLNGTARLTITLI